MVNITTTGWVSEPVGRGTFGILRSCVVTLILCVYTSIHLNVFPPGTNWWWRFCKKLQWVLIGMFAPEYVIYVAWVQRETARNLGKRIQAILQKQKEENPEVVRKHEWTFTHSWYAVMGGFMFDTNEEGEDEYIPGSKTVILLPLAVEELAEMGHLPDIPRTLILDKSKADSFAKAVVVIQASWLVLQCITRWIVHLPVTNLEINTLAHSVCALLVYALWWDKPLDIRDPTMLSGEWTRPVCATMHIISFSRGTFWLDDSNIQKVCQRAGLNILTCPGYDTRLQRHVDWSRSTVQVVNLNTGAVVSRPISKQTNRNSTTEAAVVLQLYEVILPLGIGSCLWTRSKEKALKVTPSVTTRWQIYIQARHEIKFMNVTSGRYLGSDKFPNRIAKAYGLQTFGYADLVTMGPRSLVGDNSRYRSMGRAVSIFVLCAVAYGGVHAISWNGFFSTATERLLWQISSISVTSCSILGFAVYLFAENVEEIFDFLDPSLKFLDHHLEFLGDFLSFLFNWLDNILFHDVIASIASLIIVILCLFAGLLVVLYFFSRAYLVVEAFVSLRKMQVQAYETPAWTQFLPHL